MDFFQTTLSQMIFLFLLIVLGYVLVKCKALGEESSKSLAKLENTVFVPALILKTFIENFTIEKLSSAWVMFVSSCILAAVMLPLSILVSKLCIKDKYIQKIYTYGLSFSNFGFMGNAIVSAIFPDIFFEYIIFTLPLWILIYIWGVPKLLIADSGKQTLKDKIKPFINPMFIAMFIGMIIGLLNIKLPTSIGSAVSSLSACMSPVAMIMTGITLASVELKKILKEHTIYIVSFVRLIVFPGLFMLVISFCNLPQNLTICAVCSLAMPLGLNTIVIPSAYGKDTSIAAGMAVVSHLASCITIPVVFYVMMSII